MLETLLQLDQQLLLTLNGWHSLFGDHFMYLVSSKLIWGPLYLALLFVLYKNFNIALTFFLFILIVLLVVYTDQLCSSIIRPYFERMRPSNLNNPISEFIHIVNEKRGGRYGFPSCHASNTFGLAWFIMFLFKARWLTLFMLFWAVLNSYSRIYLGVHYPGDILGGFIVGLSGAILMYSLFRYALRNKKIISLLRYDSIQRKRIEFHQNIQCPHIPIYAGIGILIGITIYSSLVLC